MDCYPMGALVLPLTRCPMRKFHVGLLSCAIFLAGRRITDPALRHSRRQARLEQFFFLSPRLSASELPPTPLTSALGQHLTSQRSDLLAASFSSTRRLNTSPRLPALEPREPVCTDKATTPPIVNEGLSSLLYFQDSSVNRRTAAT